MKQESGMQGRTWVVNVLKLAGFALLLTAPTVACGEGPGQAEQSAAGSAGAADLPGDSAHAGNEAGGAKQPGAAAGASGSAGGAGRTGEGSAKPSPFEGLWVTGNLPADHCEDFRLQSSARYLRVRRDAHGALQLVQLAADVPLNSLNDPGYEPCAAALIVEGEHAHTAEPYFCETIARNENGTASTQAVNRKVLTDELTLVGDSLHEQRTNADNDDCGGTSDYQYTKSSDDQHGQLAAPANIDVTGYWRTNHGVDTFSGLYVELDLEQAGVSVTGKFDITSQYSGTLTGTIKGTHLTGMIEDNSGYPPDSFDFAFSADTLRFVGHYGTVGVWNGAND
ncbi:MAG: hypothetical protein ABUL60_24305 [Myxococcales bacterium]